MGGGGQDLQLSSGPRPDQQARGGRAQRFLPVGKEVRQHVGDVVLSHQ
jgi:hypothetical protein